MQFISKAPCPWQTAIQMLQCYYPGPVPFFFFFALSCIWRLVYCYNVTVFWNLYHRPLNLILTSWSNTNKRLVHTKDTNTECVWTAAFILPQISKPVYMRSEIPPATTPLPPLPPQQPRDFTICEIGETWPSPGYGMCDSECLCVCVCEVQWIRPKKVLLNISWFFKSQHMAG